MWSLRRNKHMLLWFCWLWSWSQKKLFLLFSYIFRAIFTSPYTGQWAIAIWWYISSCYYRESLFFIEITIKITITCKIYLYHIILYLCLLFFTFIDSIKNKNIYAVVSVFQFSFTKLLTRESIENLSILFLIL